ncbi:hypothetical protein VTK73DRAFT_5862 [Phialemonium thermophilum]|uniref:AA1-like domain-containing protein n=1 Tax=Phialemonium thermophilum TaxID=223376 RepID=A0ABR3WLU2_9PEZI
MARLAKVILLCLAPLVACRKRQLDPVSTNCTAASSLAASWVVRNFTADTDTKFDFGPGTAGRVSFSITNTANGYNFTCLQGDGATGRAPNHYVVDGKVWYSCNVYCKGAEGEAAEEDPLLPTSFHFDAQDKSLSITQSWPCRSGNWSQTTLRGTGTATIPDLTCSPIPHGRPDQMSCAPVDIIVKPANVSIVAPTNGTEEEDGSESDPYADTAPPVNPFNPLVLPTPAVQPSSPDCNRLSENPTFRVSNFYFSMGGVTFTLENTALNYTQMCNIAGAPDQPVQDVLQTPAWWNCSYSDPNHVDYPPGGVYTTVLYGGPQNILGVNQSWYCDGEDASEAIIYSAYGEANFPLKCNETRSCVPPGPYDSKPKPTKVVYDFCRADDLRIVPSHSERWRVPKADAVAEFQPRGYNCSSKSLEAVGKYGWDITGFTLNKTYVPPSPLRNASGDYTDVLEFFYNNTATDNDWPRNTGWRQCLYITDDASGTLDGETQLTCAMSFEPFTLAFRFDNKTSTLSLSQSWTCDGVDSGHTNVFTAVGTGQLPVACTVVGNNTRCAQTGPLTVPISNITAQLNTNQTIVLQGPPVNG